MSALESRTDSLPKRKREWQNPNPNSLVIFYDFFDKWITKKRFFQYHIGLENIRASKGILVNSWLNCIVPGFAQGLSKPVTNQCGCSTTASTTAFQAVDEGSIPFTRSYRFSALEHNISIRCLGFRAEERAAFVDAGWSRCDRLKQRSNWSNDLRWIYGCSETASVIKSERYGITGDNRVDKET